MYDKLFKCLAFSCFCFHSIIITEEYLTVRWRRWPPLMYCYKSCSFVFRFSFTLYLVFLLKNLFFSFWSLYDRRFLQLYMNSEKEIYHKEIKIKYVCVSILYYVILIMMSWVMRQLLKNYSYLSLYLNHIYYYLLLFTSFYWYINI